MAMQVGWLASGCQIRIIGIFYHPQQRVSAVLFCHAWQVALGCLSRPSGGRISSHHTLHNLKTTTVPIVRRSCHLHGNLISQNKNAVCLLHFYAYFEIMCNLLIRPICFSIIEVRCIALNCSLHGNGSRGICAGIAPCRAV